MNNSANFSTGTGLFGSGGPSAAKLLANKCDVSCLRTNTLLRKEEWVDLDKRVVQVARERLTVVQDLIGAGLTLTLGGLGVTISQFETESDMSDASVSMEADVMGQQDQLDYGLQSVPIPIIHKDFKLGIRQLEASRRMGSNIDMTNSDAATRKVAEGAEDLVIKGLSKKINGYSIYGLTTHPNRITDAAPGHWDTIANIYATVLSMIGDANAKKQFGPFILYVATDVATTLYQIYADITGQTALERILKIPQIKEVKAADRLPAGNVVLVQMLTTTIDLAIAQTLIPIEWNTMGGLVSWFKIMMAFAPRIKPDANGNLGIVHYTGCM